MRRFLLFMLSVAAMVLFAASSWASPYAVEVVDYSGPFGGSPYDDPQAVLGKPATNFENMGFGGGGSARVKLVEPAYNVDAQGNKLITTLNSGSYITVKFDHKVMDDPDNPYNLDFLVFGNSFYTGSGFVSDVTNLNTYMLTGGGWMEPVTVSVSQDGNEWYTYADGPYGDGAFPTQGYAYDAANARWTDIEMDFTKPVDPSLVDTLAAGGMSAADAIALYQGSGGGTGFDLAESGYHWIQYIKVEGTGGEIDAFSDVAPTVPVPGTFSILAAGLLGLTGIRRKVN